MWFQCRFWKYGVIINHLRLHKYNKIILKKTSDFIYLSYEFSNLSYYIISKSSSPSHTYIAQTTHTGVLYSLHLRINVFSLSKFLSLINIIFQNSIQNLYYDLCLYHHYIFFIFIFIYFSMQRLSVEIIKLLIFLVHLFWWLGTLSA